MRILFSRHGESEANIQQIISNRDLPHHLTARGAEQAAALADRLAGWPVRMVLCSPILRARETAAILADRLSVPFTSADALREFDCGIMEGRGDEQAWAAHQTAMQTWLERAEYDFRISPDAESFADVRARFVPLIDQLMSAKTFTDGDVLLVSHGSVLHMMLPLVLANIDRQFVRAHPLGNCDLIVTAVVDGKLVCNEWAGIPVN